jgi:hypothetical protein
VSIELMRDEFACAALNGIIAAVGSGLQGSTAQAYAELAYLYADAMLLARRAYCPVCQQKTDPEKGYIIHVSGCTYGWPEEGPTGEGL